VLAVVAAAAEGWLLGKADPATLAERAPLAAAWLFTLVFADAAACDIGDEPGDAAAGATTLPIRLGRARTRGLALAISAAAGVGLLGWLAAADRLTPAGWVWAIGPVATLAAALAARPDEPRTPVDARLIIVALAASVAG